MVNLNLGGWGRSCFDETTRKRHEKSMKTSRNVVNKVSIVDIYIGSWKLTSTWNECHITFFLRH